MTPPRRMPFALVISALAVVVTAVCLLGIGVRSTYGGRAAVDEPEYLLTALSLAEDGDLDISDELAAERWRDFHDAALPVQTAALPGNRRISPHDPLLPVLLAVPMGLGGFVAAKATLAVLSGVLAALTCWVAVRRLGVAVPVAAAVVGLASVSPPLGIYATQVYPEVPAALAAMAGLAAVTGSLTRRGLVAVGVAVTALPWLSVKYSPVAAALAAVALVRLVRRADRARAWALTGGLALMGIAFAVAHRGIYGGWTAYATGDHFENSGELAVVGTGVDLPGRSLRLVGLLADRGFGIAAWQPMWLLLPLVVAALVRRRPPLWAAVAAPLAAGWLTATYVALTAHGYWWPGRQVVVVLPLGVLALCWWVGAARLRVTAACALGVVGVATFGWLLADGFAERITWVSGFETTRAPAYRTLRPLLPDYRDPGAATSAAHLLWCAALVALLVIGWRSVVPAADRSTSPADQPQLDPVP